MECGQRNFHWYGLAASVGIYISIFTSAGWIKFLLSCQDKPHPRFHCSHHRLSSPVGKKGLFTFASVFNKITVLTSLLNELRRSANWKIIFSSFVRLTTKCHKGILQCFGQGINIDYEPDEVKMSCLSVYRRKISSKILWFGNFSFLRTKKKREECLETLCCTLPHPEKFLEWKKFEKKRIFDQNVASAQYPERLKSQKGGKCSKKNWGMKVISRALLLLAMSVKPASDVDVASISSL